MAPGASRWGLLTCGREEEGPGYFRSVLGVHLPWVQPEPQAVQRPEQPGTPSAVRKADPTHRASSTGGHR